MIWRDVEQAFSIKNRVNRASCLAPVLPSGPSSWPERCLSLSLLQLAIADWFKPNKSSCPPGNPALMDRVTCKHSFKLLELWKLCHRQGQCELETQLWFMSGLSCEKGPLMTFYHSPHAAAIDHCFNGPINRIGNRLEELASFLMADQHEAQPTSVFKFDIAGVAAVARTSPVITNS